MYSPPGTVIFIGKLPKKKFGDKVCLTLLQGMFNVIDWHSGMKVDFIVRKNDEFQQTEFARRLRKTILDTIACWIISPEDLILAKLLWIQQLYSQQQVDDIKNVMLDYPALDKAYIIGWIKKLQLTTFDLFSI